MPTPITTGTLSGKAFGFGSGAGTLATWNPADKASGVTLINGDLTAKGLGGVRATVGKTTGKYYFEINYDLGVPDTNQRQLFGIFPQSTSVNASDPSPGAVQLNSGGGEVDVNGVNVGLWCPVNIPVQGDKACIAVNFDAGLFWARLNGGNWNNNVSADPASGAGGFSISGLSGLLYPGLWLLNNSEGVPQFTANFGASAFSFSVPSGFRQGWF